jgi:predicted TIM-barrel fold metal-dependent hydrolase
MSIQLQSRPTSSSRAGLAIIDCDVHPSLRTIKDLHPFLSARWRQHLDTYGIRIPTPFLNSSAYPKATPALSRRDAWPPNGQPPGSDLPFLRKQLLDAYNVEYGILQTLSPIGMQERNQEFGAAICSAVNDWQYHEWTQKEPRLKGSINVPGDDAEAALQEIERLGDNPDFVQIAMACRGTEPLGRKRYWPIYEAAARYDLPITFHVSGENGHPLPGGAGWSSYYQESHHSVSFWHRSMATSLVFEGVLERFPTLRFILVEGGFAWVPGWTWRMDHQWSRLRGEVPHIKKPPSEYIRECFYFTTQPMDEPERPDDLRDIIDWIGWDRLLFATDYPHWDFDDPMLAFKCRLSESERRKLAYENARSLFRLT